MSSEHKFEREAVPKRNKAGGLDRSAYEQLVQSVVDYAIFMLDPEGHVSSWNPGAERIKGYTADEIIGEHFSRFYTPEDRDAGLPEHVLKQAAGRGPVRRRRLARAQGRQPFLGGRRGRPDPARGQAGRLRQDHPRHDRAAARPTWPRWRASAGSVCWSRA